MLCCSTGRARDFCPLESDFVVGFFIYFMELFFFLVRICTLTALYLRVDQVDVVMTVGLNLTWMLKKRDAHTNLLHVKDTVVTAPV